MEFVYALINFALLAGVVYLFGRKKIAAIFRDRLARINSGLDLAEKAGAAAARAGGAARARGAAALGRAGRAGRAPPCRSMNTGSRRSSTRRARICAAPCCSRCATSWWNARRRQAAERLACEPYRSSLRSHEAEMVDGVLEEICLSPRGQGVPGGS